MKEDRLRMADNEDDCVVLDFNPFNQVSKKYTLHNDKELSIISSKGPIVNREWPHWRHLCDNLPLEMISYEKCCKKCYCYVCDKQAPCKAWKTHCHANDGEQKWKQLRLNLEPAWKKMRRATTSHSSDSDSY